jgi:hypothetical protein
MALNRGYKAPTERWTNSDSQSDFLQLVAGRNDVIGGIDGSGAPYGTMAGKGGTSFGTYTFSTDGTTVTATNNVTGVTQTGTDAAALINTILLSLQTVGGVLFFKNGIYPIKSMTQETGSGWTNIYYGVGIPANVIGTQAQFHFIGESATVWPGEIGQLLSTNFPINTNGVIFLVSAAAIASVPTGNTSCVFFQRPITSQSSYPQSNDIYFENLYVRHQSNQRGNTIGIAMYCANDIGYKNVGADFNQTYHDIAVGSAPVQGTQGSFGLTSSYSGSSSWQHFMNTFSTGYWSAYDLQSEHIVGDSMTAQYSTYAAHLGRGASAAWPSSPVVSHPVYLYHFNEQECANGIQFGGNMANGSTVTIIGYAEEDQLTAGSFLRVQNAFEVNNGNSSGYILFSKVTQNGSYNAGAFFAAGSGQNFLIQNGNAANALGLKVIGATPTSNIIAGQIGLGSTTAATASAGAATLPANPLGFLEINLAGVLVKIPYYSV